MPRICRAAWAALVLVVLVPVAASPAHADDFFHATTTSIVEWHGDNRDDNETNDHFIDVVNKINLSFSSGLVSTDLRVDTFTLLNTSPFGKSMSAPIDRTYADDYRIERLTGILRPTKDLKLTIGDFYAQFGNGIALSLRKVDELGLETVLRGARVDGKLGIFSFTLLGGVTNINNLDPQDYYFVEDPLDRLAGLRTELKIPGGRLKFGVHGLWTQPSMGTARSDMNWVVGGNLEAVLVPAKLLMGAEFDYGWFQTFDDYDKEHPQRFKDPEGPDVPGDYHKGFAAYLNLRAKLGPVSILAEGKWYDTFAVEGSLRYPDDTVPLFYNQPPTAERIDQEVDNSHTVIGGRLKLDYRVLPNLTIYANVGGGDYVSVVDMFKASSNALHIGQYIHTYVGIDWRWDMSRSSLSISGGWRGERDPEDIDGDLDEGWRKKEQVAHGEAKLNLFLGGPWTLHATFLHEWRTKRELVSTGFGMELAELEYNRGTHIVGIDWAGILSFSAAFEYDTDPGLEYSGDKSMRYFDMWKYHGWGQIKWFVRKNLILSLLGGTQRGGLKCVGGVCKILPPFAGVKTELVFRY